MINKIKPLLVPASLLVAVIAMAGSLYFSEVQLLVPCVLCWYQRLTIYPLVAVFLVSLFRNDEKVYDYAWPFLIVGIAISMYHNILYYAVNWGMRPDWSGPCVAGVSCTTRYIEWFGFVTIPLMSLLAHLFIAVCMLLLWKWNKAKGLTKTT
ncbi:disulfide bond formation protein B [Candidatus Uhrbacteria bacterium]|nr:disulfide bond formation protein B [Candidatus Uhrbacteria bacterium]